MSIMLIQLLFVSKGLPLDQQDIEQDRERCRKFNLKSRHAQKILQSAQQGSRKERN